MSEFTLDSILSSLSDAPAETQIEKVASENIVSAADTLKEQLLTKEASASNNGESNMSVETGNAIADSILNMLDGGMNKAASAGDVTQGNNVIKELDEMEKEHGDRILQTPRQGKSVTEVAKALQARAPAGSGADSIEVEDAASREGNIGANVAAIPSDIEKSAAINDLMEEGYGLDDAYEMVKAASEEMIEEAFELEKIAAVETLMDEGVDFDDAIQLVKMASEELLEDEGEEEYSDLEKIAAVAELMDEDGLGFEEASELVKQASAASAVREFSKRVGGSRVSASAAKVRGAAKSYLNKGTSKESLAKDVNRLKGYSSQTSRARKQLAAGTVALGGAGYAAGRSRNN